jgi:large subunit ribosomal protein L24
MKLKTNDTVIITAGKDKGKKGKILRLLVDKNQVVVERVNIRTKHVKKSQAGAGEIIKYEAPIHASNVQIIDSKTGKPSRISYREVGGKKIRIAVRSGEPVAEPAVAK